MTENLDKSSYNHPVGGDTRARDGGAKHDQAHGRLGVWQGWSSSAARIIHRGAGVPKGQGFGHQVQTGRQAKTEDGASEAISDKSAGGRGIITGKEWGGRSKECARNPYEWGT